MAATSTEIGGLFAEGQGHEIAQGYGLSVGGRRALRDGRLAGLGATVGGTPESTGRRRATARRMPHGLISRRSGSDMHVGGRHVLIPGNLAGLFRSRSFLEIARSVASCDE